MCSPQHPTSPPMPLQPCQTQNFFGFLLDSERLSKRQPPPFLKGASSPKLRMFWFVLGNSASAIEDRNNNSMLFIGVPRKPVISSCPMPGPPGYQSMSGTFEVSCNEGSDKEGMLTAARLRPLDVQMLQNLTRRCGV